MKKKQIAAILTATVILSLLAGCKKDEEAPPEVETPVNVEEEEEEEPAEVESIEINFTDEMPLVSISYDSDKKELHYGLKNETMFPLNYGAAYDIMQKKEDGTFVRSGHTDDMAFTEELRTVDIDGFVNDSISFTGFSKEFEDGTYYIVREYNNGDGTEGGKHIPLVKFSMKDGSVYQKKAGEIEVEHTVHAIHKLLGFIVTEELTEPITFAMTPEFYEINPDTGEKTKVDFGLENHGLFAESVPGEDFYWEIDLSDATFEKAGNYEARIRYSLQDGTSNDVVIPVFVRYNLDDESSLTIYLQEVEWGGMEPFDFTKGYESEEDPIDSETP